MTKWEVLSRGSAALIALKTPTGAATPSSRSASIAAIASHHVTHPYLPRFSSYYPPSEFGFLSLLQDDPHHVRCTLEMRASPGGEVLSQVPVQPGAIIGHPTRDCSATLLEDGMLEELVEGANAALLPSSTATSIHVQPLFLADSPAPENSALSFHGHFLLPLKDKDQDDADISLLLPKQVEGKLLVRGGGGRQVFAKTQGVILEMGMCGGPVVWNSNGNSGSAYPVCAGVVEGIVPSDFGSGSGSGSSRSSLSSSSSSEGASDVADAKAAQARRILAGCAVYVESDVLREFLVDVVAGAAGGRGARGEREEEEGEGEDGVAALRRRARLRGRSGSVSSDLPEFPIVRRRR